MASVSSPLSSNTISSLVLHGAAFERGLPAIFPFFFGTRMSPPLDLVNPTRVLCTCNSRNVLPNGVPPASLFLNRQLRQPRFWTNRRRLFHCAYSLVPFVVKIANRKRNNNLLRKAWFYDELQTLQGSTIPKSYGYFVPELPESCTFESWKTHEDRGFEVNMSELDDASYSDVGTFNVYRDILGRFETKPVITLLHLEPLGEPFCP
ncbi:hypothetical protein Hypma_012308 [Hypsizygus marmoreus]|uniref:Uncharacterized protein n=1 Tax=Hypsizygus marmoreus TaxID=39966 RepID=A0A369JLP0_HYPMA|nr:hypothetical protein Hypma_012308 [Hypsizygus marmoreus]